MNGISCYKNGDQSVGIDCGPMETTGYKVFNDAVHGHITLHPLLVKVVDTPEFQRLRNIKQLGVAYYVFPAAGHCRFEHCLGTCYLAGKMVRKLMSREVKMNLKKRTEKEIERWTLCVQLAALCHDIGHGPFSHTWELLTKEWGYNWKHENSSVLMFDYLIKQNNLRTELNDYGLDTDIIKELIMGEPLESRRLLSAEDNYLYEIVSNARTGIDVDKWDYFLRDGLHLNLHITFDYRRLLEFCIVQKSSDGRTHIAFRDKEIMNLYDMYRVRSALHHTAYRHKVVISIELMVIDAFKAASDVHYTINDSRVLLKEAHLNPESMSKLTDHVFYDILYSKKESLKNARTLLHRVVRRDLYMFLGQTKIKLPESKQERKSYIELKKSQLQMELKTCSEVDFRVIEFYLDLDLQNDPVANMKFYQKERQSNTISEQSYTNIRDLLDPFPFHLAREATGKLLVFSTTKVTDTDALLNIQNIIEQFC